MFTTLFFQRSALTGQHDGLAHLFVARLIDIRWTWPDAHARRGINRRLGIASHSIALYRSHLRFEMSGQLKKARFLQLIGPAARAREILISRARRAPYASVMLIRSGREGSSIHKVGRKSEFE